MPASDRYAIQQVALAKCVSDIPETQGKSSLEYHLELRSARKRRIVRAVTRYSPTRKLLKYLFDVIDNRVIIPMPNKSNRDCWFQFTALKRHLRIPAELVMGVFALYGLQRLVRLREF